MTKKTKIAWLIVLIIIPFSGFEFSDVLAQSSTFGDASPKIYFDNFEALIGDRFLISQLSGEMLAQIYNAKDKKIVKDLIRSGRGPFELEYMGGMAFNRETKRLYAADLQNGKIVSFDDLGNPLTEKRLIIIYPRFIDAYKDELVVTSVARVGEGMPNRNRYPISYLLDPNTLEISDTLFFDLDELDLERIKDFDKSPTFQVSPLVVSSFKKGLYLVVFEGFNKIFLINKNSELVDEIGVNLNNIETPTVVKHPTFGYGQRIYSILNDYTREGESIYFSFGHTTKNIPNGLVKVTISDGDKLSAQKQLLKTETEWEPTNNLNPFNISSDGQTIYGADGIDIIPLAFD